MVISSRLMASDRHRCSPGRLERGDVRYAVINGSPHNPDMVLPGRLVRGGIDDQPDPAGTHEVDDVWGPLLDLAHQVCLDAVLGEELDRPARAVE